MGKIIHGHTKRREDGRVFSPEYSSYVAMKNRCYNKRQGRYEDYGGRGIVVCERWLTGDGVKSGFECFLQDVGPKPSPRHSLDRYPDNDGDYGPRNVRWASRGEQDRNKRTARIVDVCGEPVNLCDAVARWGAVSDATARMRLHRGWPADAAIWVPVGGKSTDPIGFGEVPF